MTNLQPTKPPPRLIGPLPDMGSIERPAEHPDVEFWRRLGFTGVTVQSNGLAGTLPLETTALRAACPEGAAPLNDLLKRLGTPPSMILRDAGGPTFLFRVTHGEAVVRLRTVLSETVEVLFAGNQLRLPPPSSIQGSLRIDHLRDMAVLDVPDPHAPVAAETNFLRQFSLQGKAGELEARAQQELPLLGNICLSGQATIWYAPPNAGKTLCALRMTHDAITEGRIAAGDVYYFNADDSSSGLAQKLRIMDDLGAHTIAPGFGGFKNADLLEHLKQTAMRNEARGTLVIVDTVKKMTSLMDKRQSSEFAEACRQYAMRGGTVLGLAHTAKNPNPNGKLRYAGTTDLLEDFDAGYLLTPLEGVGEPGERIVQFEALKRRGDNAELAAYSYASEGGMSYEERLLSLEAIDPANIDDFRRIVEAQDDAPIIEAIIALIGEGVNQKMLLAKAAAKRCAASERATVRVLERYTGNSSDQGRWRFSVRARGAKVFELHPPAAP